MSALSNLEPCLWKSKIASVVHLRMLKEELVIFNFAHEKRFLTRCQQTRRQMACFDRVSLGFLIHLCLWPFHRVDGTVIKIYSSLEPYSTLANLSRPGWTNYTLEASNTDEHVTLLQILSIVQQTDYCE